jgi:4-alpha-glucanotransferase
MRSKIARRSGVLLHPSSFPGPWGIGDLGPQAYAFIDFLGDTHQQLWQVLPLGPTGDDGSPYSSFSASAGNPLLISIEALVDEGFSTPASPPEISDSGPVDQRQVRASKLPALKQLWQEFTKTSQLRAEFETFCAGAVDWLDDYALFMALNDAYPAKAWNQWPEALARREAAALERARRDLGDLVSCHQFFQFVFYRQWSRLRDYAHDRGIRIVGDIPFYMAFNSADVWTNSENFALDAKTREPRLMAGVPPDYFSKTGQLWGNPVYDWRHLEHECFDWWVGRFKRLTQLVDIVRIDHFRGFQAFWQVKQGETTAVNGEWAECPGDAFFHTLEHELGHLPVWAEDLGLVTPQVEKLRDDFDFPGMKVLQFGFDDSRAENPYLPFNFPQNCVCYTGTHDNDTTVGWWTNLAPSQKQQVLAYIGDDEPLHWAMIRLAMSSIADTVIVPLQDILGLGSDARMNTPGRAQGNWSWRYPANVFTDNLKGQLELLTTTFGRSPRFTTNRPDKTRG